MTEREPFYVPARALAVFAHCDDIEFGVSGTVARWAAAGANVTYAIMTDSSAGSNEPDADLDQLKQTRKQEQIAAAAAVGVDDVRFFDDYTRMAHLNLLWNLRKDITRLIRELRPNVVLTFDPETVCRSRPWLYQPPGSSRRGGVRRYMPFSPAPGAVLSSLVC